MPPAPPPIHTLRTHSAPIASLAFAADNSLIYSGDQDGFLSITDAKTRRALALWKGHEAGVLGVQEWDGRLISYVYRSRWSPPSCNEVYLGITPQFVKG